MSRSKVGVKVMGQGQRSRSNFCLLAVDIRGSALPSAARANKSHYQSGVFVCVSNCHADAVDRLLIFRAMGIRLQFTNALSINKCSLTENGQSSWCTLSLHKEMFACI